LDTFTNIVYDFQMVAVSRKVVIEPQTTRK